LEASSPGIPDGKLYPVPSPTTAVSREGDEERGTYVREEEKAKTSDMKNLILLKL
jgi:hypothetical protein